MSNLNVTIYHPNPSFTGMVTIMETVTVSFISGSASTTLTEQAILAFREMGYTVNVGGGTPPPGYDVNLDAGVAAILGSASSQTTAAARAAYGRLPQAPNRLYVETTGSDSNDGRSPGGALKTISAALAKVAAAAVPSAHIYVGPGTHSYGATDGSSGGSTIRLLSNVHIHGTAGGSGGGTIIQRTVDDGNPMFDSLPTQPLANCVVEDLQITTTLAAQPTASTTAHGIKAYCLTNNSAFRRIEGQNLRGDVVNLAPNTPTGDTVHGMFNAELDQIFGVGCGGYCVNVNGRPNGLIRMPDGSNMVGGLVKLSNGISNQAACVIEMPIWEGGTGSTSLQPILLQDMGGQTVVIVGGSFGGATGSTDVVRVAGASAATPLLIGVAGNGFTNWINDVVTPTTWPMTTKTTYFLGDLNGNSVSASGPGATVELYDTLRTVNQRKYRWSVSGGILVCSRRNDDGSSAGDAFYVYGSSGRFEVANDLKVDGNVGFYNTNPVAKPTVTGSRGGNAALASLLTALASQGLITDSSTA